MVKVLMVENVNKVDERGDKLQDLEERSAKLLNSVSSALFPVTHWDQLSDPFSFSLWEASGSVSLISPISSLIERFVS